MNANTSTERETDAQPYSPGFDQGWTIWDSNGIREMTRQELSKMLGLPQEGE